MKGLINYISEKLKISKNQLDNSEYNWDLFLSCLEEICKTAPYKAEFHERPRNFPNIFEHYYENKREEDQGIMFASINSPDLLEAISYEYGEFAIYYKPFYERKKHTTVIILKEYEFDKFLEMFKYYEHELNYLYEDIINYQDNN